MLFCQGCLTDSDLRIQKIIISQLTRFNRLLVPIKKWTGFFNVGPLGKPFTPPAVIFRDFMILRQIKSDNFWFEDFLLSHTVINLFIIPHTPYIQAILMSIINELELQLKILVSKPSDPTEDGANIKYVELLFCQKRERVWVSVSGDTSESFITISFKGEGFTEPGKRRPLLKSSLCPG